MLLQLNPPLPLNTPRGKALAHVLIDYGAEHHLLWVCALDNGGEIWTYPNPQVRFQENISMNRRRDRVLVESVEFAGEPWPLG